jgi:methylated-DNA-[protein]-cysteine S-methyltransferase
LNSTGISKAYRDGNSPEHAVLQLATQQLQEYFAGQRQHFDLPLDMSSGTPFQQSVWRALQILSADVQLRALAASIDKLSAVRAVGAANGRNPLSIIVPCHRVIATNGALTGYAGGLKISRPCCNLRQINLGINPRYLPEP